MCIVISRVDVQWDDAFLGFVPSKYIFQSGGLYICAYRHDVNIFVLIVNLAVGIIGATVMPHSLFLGSALATQDRVSSKPLPAENDTDNMSDSSSEKLAKPSVCQRIGRQMLTSVTSAFASPPPSSYSTTVTRHGDRENNTLSFVSAHIYHGIVDIVSSLLGFAVLINSL